jgi:hypothetical protein
MTEAAETSPAFAFPCSLLRLSLSCALRAWRKLKFHFLNTLRYLLRGGTLQQIANCSCDCPDTCEVVDGGAAAMS